jgi:uncharacterized membrane protein
METKNLYSFQVEWNYKQIGMFALLLLIPNFLSLINFSTPFGFKIHFFQIAIFTAAFIYGPVAGMMSGLFGSFVSAVTMHNPYIVVGNMILGFFVGLFARHGFDVIIAVMLGFLIQLPWLVITDYYLVHLPVGFIASLVAALTISNLIWAIVAKYATKPIQKLLG